MLLAQIVYSIHPVRSSGVPVMLPLDSRISPEGNAGLTSQVSMSGPSLVAGMRMLSLASSANSNPGHEIASGGRLVILNCSVVEAGPPELLAQTV